ncbi:MAG: ArnT family glycosyltransferase [Flammeovirgaceae bacterium]
MKTNYYLLFIPIGIVYFIGMFNDVMEVDASQYAAMSREMLESGSYLQLCDRGLNYLDKPPLLFWVSALSFKLFGISNFTYKLPSVLFSLLGIFATYQLGKRLYGEKTGFYSALVLASCQAWFMMNQDIRTDTILAACTIFGIWQLFIFMDQQKFVHLILGSVGVAGAMLTKGPIGLMVPALGIGFYLLVKRDWKNLFNWKWLLMPVIVGVCISPFLYGLFQQYDLQPGKLIQGEPIRSGVKFYLWTQSFGRLTGESVWKDDTTQLFFTHTFLWAFLPWCVLFVAALWRDTVELVKSRLHLVNGYTALTWGGFVFPFIAFSLSHYKLPHYIFVIFPLAAIKSANFLDCLIENGTMLWRTRWKWIQLFVSSLVYALGALLCTWAFPMTNPISWIVVLIGIGASIYFVWKGISAFEKLVLPSASAIIILNFLLNSHFYPTLFHFTTSNQAAKIVKAQGGEQNFKTLNQVLYGLDVYSLRTIPNYSTVDELLKSSNDKILWVYTNEPGHQEILARGLKIIEDKKMEHFHISTLSMLFLNPKTRSKEIEYKYLIKIDTSNL